MAVYSAQLYIVQQVQRYFDLNSVILCALLLRKMASMFARTTIISLNTHTPAVTVQTNKEILLVD